MVDFLWEQWAPHTLNFKACIRLFVKIIRVLSWLMSLSGFDSCFLICWDVRAYLPPGPGAHFVWLFFKLQHWNLTWTLRVVFLSVSSAPSGGRRLAMGEISVFVSGRGGLAGAAWHPHWGRALWRIHLDESCFCVPQSPCYLAPLSDSLSSIPSLSLLHMTLKIHNKFSGCLLWCFKWSQSMSIALASFTSSEILYFPKASSFPWCISIRVGGSVVAEMNETYWLSMLQLHLPNKGLSTDWQWNEWVRAAAVLDSGCVIYFFFFVIFSKITILAIWTLFPRTSIHHCLIWTCWKFHYVAIRWKGDV